MLQHEVFIAAVGVQCSGLGCRIPLSPFEFYNEALAGGFPLQSESRLTVVNQGDTKGHDD
jgi:hypothetical protein